MSTLAEKVYIPKASSKFHTHQRSNKIRAPINEKLRDFWMFIVFDELQRVIFSVCWCDQRDSNLKLLSPVWEHRHLKPFYKSQLFTASTACNSELRTNARHSAQFENANVALFSTARRHMTWQPIILKKSFHLQYAYLVLLYNIWKRMGCTLLLQY